MSGESGRPSSLGPMVRLIGRALRARNAPPVADGSVPRRKVASERAAIPIDAAHVRAYTRATAGEHLSDFAGTRGIVPPFYPATWETALALEMFADMERPLPLGAMVHVSTDLVWARPLRTGDAVRCRVELDRVETTRRGLRLTVLARNWLGAGQLCCQSTNVFQVRTRSADEGGQRARPQRPESDVGPESGWTEMVRWNLPGGAGRRYARVSGDYNPIHLWALTARPFGFRAPILHGYATAGRAASTLIEHCLNGEAAALRSIRIHFRAPLPLPATACFLVNDHGGRHWFRVAAPGEGPVYAEGTYGARTDGGE